MRALIVDDETKSREALQTLINDHCENIRVVGLAGNVDEALRQIKVHEPDILFLDISMPGGSGFDLLRKVPEIYFEVIFVTAHDNYAIQAIKSNAVDYLLKPVSIEDLKQAIAKAAVKLSGKQKPENLMEIIGALEARVFRQQNKIAIPTSYGLEFVPLNQIISLAADGSYTCISLSGKNKILSTRHLKEYEHLLPQSEFIRVHHSYIINLEHVKHYHKGEGGSVIMDDGTEIMISKRKKKEFLDRFSV